jgi:hypothetical protein
MLARINGEPGVVHFFGEDASRKAFAALWDGINGKRAAWASNPWVWVIGFGRTVAPMTRDGLALATPSSGIDVLSSGDARSR